MCEELYKVCIKEPCLFKSPRRPVKQGCMHVANHAFAPFQEFATGHLKRDLGGQCLLRSGQYGLLHRDDAE